MLAQELIGLAKVAAVTSGLTVVFLSEIGRVSKVEGSSMQPTFNPTCGNRNESLRLLYLKGCSRREVSNELRTRITQDRVFLSKRAVRQRKKMRVGDVVVLMSPKDPDKILVKRISAMPGDMLFLVDKNRTETIGEGHCWVEGDNPLASYDSNNFGQVPLGLIEGRVRAILWPPHRIKAITCDPSISANSTRTILLGSNHPARSSIIT